MPRRPEPALTPCGEVSAHVDTFALERLPPPELWPDILLGTRGLPRYSRRLNCAVELVDVAVAAGDGSRVAFRSDEETITYAELQERIDAIGNVLVQDLGVVPGSRVLLRSPNTPTLVASWLAVAKAGAIVVATMPLLRARELAPMLERAQIDFALCDDRLREELDAAIERSGRTVRVVEFAKVWGTGELSVLAAARREPFTPADTAVDDIVLIAFTSGTTGLPKATMHFHRDVLAICDTFSHHVLRPTADDIFIGSPSIAFTFGLGGSVTFPLRVRASAVLVETSSPDALVEAIEAHRATVVFTAPTAYRRILAAGAAPRLTTLRRCVSAGETLPQPVFEAWLDQTDLAIIDGIGATEMLHIFISASDSRIRAGATGVAVPGYEARVVDDQMRPVPPGTVGRLAVRGPTGCRYLDDPRQSDYVVDGWNLTGDAYVLDEDGYFSYQARTDDIIVTGGYNIAGPEVEEALVEHPAVLECAVVGVPDEERGMLVKAFVVPADGHEPDGVLARELQDFVKSRLAPYKYPRAVEFRTALPRTETGKLKRYELRAEATTTQTHEGSPA
ncbi:MAG: AMP-binding protein [Actinobacteria bacterium]|nr:AMP-binding protein [Actinomycetota bacterium]